MLPIVPRIVERKKPVTVMAAIVANVIIAVAKFLAGAASGSSAMVAEGIHSVVDTGNEALILVGLERSKKPPDAGHPFGYGKELYFYSLLVALAFGVGGGMSIYEGMEHLSHPAPLHSVLWSYAVLGIAFLAEGSSWWIALRAVCREERGHGILDKLHHSKDPARFVVVAEDGAALVGIAVAFVGILLRQITGSVYPDAIASMVIGALLVAVALYLVSQVEHLLVGESADRSMVRRVKEIAQAPPAIEAVRDPLTMHFGPEEVMLNLDLEFRADLSAEEVAAAVEALEGAIQDEFPEILRINIEARELGA